MEDGNKQEESEVLNVETWPELYNPQQTQTGCKGGASYYI
jgi:hypothetical protein